MTTLIIARHGNTFETGETPRRIGRRTDLPLTETGRVQAMAIGRWLRDNRMIPDVVYSSTLQRTIETARLAVQASCSPQPVFPLAIFDEIDHGPDEDRTDADIVARIGQAALDAWDSDNVPPSGWLVDPATLTGCWRDFMAAIRAHDDNETILVVTSNGIARFAAGLAVNPPERAKLATGAMAALRFDGLNWEINNWNLRP